MKRGIKIMLVLGLALLLGFWLRSAGWQPSWGNPFGWQAGPRLDLPEYTKPVVKPVPPALPTPATVQQPVSVPGATPEIYPGSNPPAQLAPVQPPAAVASAPQLPATPPQSPITINNYNGCGQECGQKRKAPPSAAVTKTPKKHHPKQCADVRKQDGASGNMRYGVCAKSFLPPCGSGMEVTYYHKKHEVPDPMNPGYWIPCPGCSFY